MAIGSGGEHAACGQLSQSPSDLKEHSFKVPGQRGMYGPDPERDSLINLCYGSGRRARQVSPPFYASLYAGLRALVRLCNDLGLKEASDYAVELRKLEHAAQNDAASIGDNKRTNNGLSMAKQLAIFGRPRRC